MKVFFAFAALSFSSSVFACPSLKGVYSCAFTGTSDQSTWVVTQNRLTYEFDMGTNGDKLEIIADGQTRKAPNGDDMLASCQGDVLNVIYTAHDKSKFFAEVSIDSAKKVMTLKYWPDTPNPDVTGWTCIRQ